MESTLLVLKTGIVVSHTCDIITVGLRKPPHLQALEAVHSADEFIGCQVQCQPWPWLLWVVVAAAVEVNDCSEALTLYSTA